MKVQLVLDGGLAHMGLTSWGGGSCAWLIVQASQITKAHVWGVKGKKVMGSCPLV